MGSGCEPITKKRLGPGGPGLVSQVGESWHYVPIKFDKSLSPNKGTIKGSKFSSSRFLNNSSLGIEITELFAVKDKTFEFNISGLGGARKSRFGFPERSQRGLSGEGICGCLCPKMTL